MSALSRRVTVTFLVVHACFFFPAACSWSVWFGLYALAVYVFVVAAGIIPMLRAHVIVESHRVTVHDRGATTVGYEEIEHIEFRLSPSALQRIPRLVLRDARVVRFPPYLDAFPRPRGTGPRYQQIVRAIRDAASANGHDLATSA